MEILVRDTDSIILQYGTGIGSQDGATIQKVSDETAAAIKEAMSTPNGGIRLLDGEKLEVLEAPQVPTPPAMYTIAELQSMASAAATLPEVRTVMGLFAQALGNRIPKP